MNKSRFVIDTTALISYFSDLFNQKSQISKKGLSIIEKAFLYEDSAVVVVPSVVFVEIFDKWFAGDKISDEEFRARFIIEVYEMIRQASNFEIREIDIEVLERFLSLDDSEINLENRDRIILASAIVLEARLITSDGKIINYIQKHWNSSAIVS